MYLAKNSFKRGKMLYLQKQDSIKPTKILPCFKIKELSGVRVRHDSNNIKQEQQQ